ncbi:MAG TPA: tetratricopeptide repeat protein [Methylomirabilota bacterium]|nr:tetratricopeptide repeat protein [Methylomirabilota bacterium]
MPLRGIRSSWSALGALLSALLLFAAPAAAKSRSVLVLPFAPLELGREEQWLGEAVAESLRLSLIQLPALIQIDRSRLRALAQPETWDEPSAQSAARSLGADLAVFGEVRRTAGELSIQPRLVELSGGGVARTALDPVAVPEGKLMERLRALPVAYARAMKIGPTDVEQARLQKYAAPTSSLRAYEAYIKGQMAANRGGQDGNETAVELLGRSVELDPQFVVAQYALGAVHQTLGNRWKAAAQFRASTQLDPTYPEPYKALGDLFLTAPRRLFDQAIEAYTKALELRPFYADAYAGLGDANAAKGDIDGAVNAYQKALNNNPLNPRVHVSLGKIYYGEKQLYYEAVNSYKKAIELDPRYVEARMGLAEVYEEKGLYQDAIGEYKKVVEQDDKNTSALYNMALVYEKVDPREAITLWERYIKLAGPLPSEKDWVDVAVLHLRKLKNQYKD